MVTEEPLPDPPAGTREIEEEEEEEPNTHSQATKPVRTDTGKVPKWLKLPGTLPIRPVEGEVTLK
jgi:hypothetical protein